jgi:chemotaxis protein MotB
MARRRRHEEEERHEAWAIPYGDLVTLLLGFFVVMYAMSSVNQGKYRVLSNSLTEAFHGTPHANPSQPNGDSGSDPIEELPLTQVQRMISAGLPSHPIAPLESQRGTLRRGQSIAGAVDPRAPYSIASASAESTSSASISAAAAPAVPTGSARAGGTLDMVADDVTAAMGPLIAKGQVRVRRYDTWVAVDISTDILYGSGSAQLSGTAVMALQKLADSLKPWPNALRVEGHTDNLPISTAAFPSNWELSAARAASVVHLFMDRGVAPERLAVMGFGPYRPASTNDNATGRNANRRVEVVILGRDSGPEGRW